MEWPENSLSPGTRIRLKANPAREGILGNELDGSPARPRVLVMFSDGNEEFVLFSAVEPKEEKALRPHDIILRGKYGGVKGLKDAITHYRLSGKISNLIYSLNTTNTQFMPHQFKPVLNFLESPASGLLIADEVGLGKTIEAGLIWTELRARFDARRLLVICPAMLREKWQMELRNRFGVKADIVSAKEFLPRISAVLSNPLEEFALIASYNGLRPPRESNRSSATLSNAGKVTEFLREVELNDPLIDLVVIDEAHYLRNEETQTNKLGELIRPVAANLLLLSATPIQLRSKDLFNLLHLLDEDAFPFESSFSEILEANQPISDLSKRLLTGTLTREYYLERLEKAGSHPLLSGSQQLAYLIEKAPNDNELKDPKARAEIVEILERINPLSKVVNRTLKREVQECRVVRRPVALSASMSEVERNFYDVVSAHIVEFCRDTDMPVGFMLTIPQRQMSSSIAAACRAWQRKGGHVETKDTSELVDELEGDSSSANYVRTTGIKGLGILLTELAEIAIRQGNYSALKTGDSKYQKLLDALKMYWSESPDQKVILFAFYKDTLRYLHERLEEDGIQSLVLHGGMDKSAVIEQFEKSSQFNLLLSSEVAAEGVDLQFSGVVINYDLPWNPMKIEQRIGRIDRIGQLAPQILIWNFMYADTIDERVYNRLLLRLGVFESAFGFMEAILGERLRELSVELITTSLTTAQQEALIDQTAYAVQNKAIQGQHLEDEAAQLIAHGDFIIERVKAAKELGRYLSGEDLYVYLQDFLREVYPGSRQDPIDESKRIYKCELSVKARVDFDAFLHHRRWQGRSRLTSTAPLPLHYENKQGGHDANLERITQEHPLVRFVTESKQKSNIISKLYPISAGEISHESFAGVDKGEYIYVVYRWSVEGAINTDRIVYLARKIGSKNYLDEVQSERLINEIALRGSDWFGASAVVDGSSAASVFDECREEIELRLVKFRSEKEMENRDRLNMMLGLLKSREKSQLEKINLRISLYRMSGEKNRLKMIPLEQGKIKKLQEGVAKRIEILKLKEELSISDSFVAGGVIKVN